MFWCRLTFLAFRWEGGVLSLLGLLFLLSLQLLVFRQPFFLRFLGFSHSLGLRDAR